jgi:hypothetical protein
MDDGSIQYVDTGHPLVSPAFLVQGLQPLGGAVGEVLYLLNLSNLPEIQRVDANSVQVLDFGYQPNYSLPVWPGDADEPARLAFGTSPDVGQPTLLIIANVDGSNIQIAHSENLVEGEAPYQIVAQRWSDDGTKLYFSREPYGIGGYIPFNGASSLFEYDLPTQSLTELIPFDPATNFLCLGDLSHALPLAVGNCTEPNQITVYNLLLPGADVTILPPAEVTEARLAGSARFNLDLTGSVAFALAKGDPENEQGWAAVFNPLLGGSILVATSEPGTYYTVVGSLDNNTLLLQQIGVSCNPVCPSSLWTVGWDGSNLTKLTDGLFIAFVGK